MDLIVFRVKGRFSELIGRLLLSLGLILKASMRSMLYWELKTLAKISSLLHIKMKPYEEYKGTSKQ